MQHRSAILILPAFIIGFICLSTSCKSKKAAAATVKETMTETVVMVDEKVWAEIAQAKALLQDGDLVTRSDDDFESITLQNFSNSDRSYSHSGIAFKEDSGFVIYHAMTGGENPAGTCRRDPFDSFVNPLKKTGFGIFRYQLSGKEKEIFHQLLQLNHQKKIPFDLTFNMKTDDSLYCSEMIYKGLKKATNNRIILPATVLHNFKPKILGYRYNQVFLKKFEYISIDNLYINPFCKEIKRVKYR